jgi:hypothetical protein
MILALEHFQQKWARFCGQNVLQVFGLEPFLSAPVGPTGAQRAVKPLAYAALCVAVLSALSGCGQPEDDGLSATTVNTPLPPYPAWSVAMIGKPLASVVRGKANCFGVFDAVEATHTGAHPGVEVEGWAWDKTAKQAVQHILIVDLNDRILGAADGGGRARSDVQTAYPEMTTKFVGWRGVVGATTGTVLAVGLGAQGGQCALSKAVKLSGSVY